MVSNKEMNQKIQVIVEKAINAEKVFKNIAENITSQGLNKYFNAKYLLKNNFIKDLNTELLKSEDSINNISESTNAHLQTTEIILKKNISKDNNQSIFEESLVIEKNILNDLEDLLDKEYLTIELRNILSNYYNIIKIEYESIKTLDDVKKVYS